MDARKSSPTPPNSPVSDLPLSNPGSPFSRGLSSLDKSHPQHVIGSTITMNETKVIFTIGGDHELVIKHARELKFVYFLNTNITAEKIEKNHSRSLSRKDWLEVKFEIDINDTNNIASMLWYLGKITGEFRSPEELLEIYSECNSPVLVHQHEDNHTNSISPETLKNTLIQAAKTAMARSNETLKMHFSTLDNLMHNNVDREFWTVAELAAYELHLQQRAIDTTPPTLSLSSWAGFFYRAPEALQQLLGINNTESSDDEFGAETQLEGESYYEFNGSSGFKLL